MLFKAFSEAVHARYTDLAKGELFVVDVENIFDTYLAAFPPGTNEILRERTIHDCNCCKQFIRKLGILVALSPEGQSLSVWDDLTLPYPYDVVAARLSDVVRQAPIRTVFRSKERSYGTDHNYDTKTNERWDHFHGAVGPKHYSADAATKRGEQEAIAQVLRRGLTEIKAADMETVLDLIDSNSLYRGGEHRVAVVEFRDLQRKYDGSENFIWANLGNRAARFRNTVIGTLLTDLAEGDYAVLDTDNGPTLQRVSGTRHGPLRSGESAWSSERCICSEKSKTRRYGLSTGMPAQICFGKSLLVLDLVPL